MIHTGDFAIEWLDDGREPKSPPDPRYPNGIDLGNQNPTVTSCKVTLPYPARRCGMYSMQCNRCSQTTLVTTAGRPDDPRSITLPCGRSTLILGASQAGKTRRQ